MRIFIFSIYILLPLLLFPTGQIKTQDIDLINVIISANIDNSYAERALFAEFCAIISRNGSIYQAVEREELILIRRERAAAAKIKDDPYVATVLRGAAVGIEFNILEYQENWDSTKVDPSKHQRSHDYSLNMSCVFSLRAIDISTSEILGSANFSIQAIPGKVEKPHDQLQKHYLRLDALKYLRHGLDELSKRFLLQSLSPRIPILKTYEPEGKQKLLISGGLATDYPIGTKFRLIRESMIEIDGTPILRQETVGEVRVDKHAATYSNCTITYFVDGLTANDLAPYVLPSPENDLPTSWFEQP